MVKSAEWNQQKRMRSIVATIIFCVFSIIGIYFRWRGKDVVSGDWAQSLSVWVAGLDRGGLQALARYEGNYNMPYVTFLLLTTYLPINPMYTVKIFSVLFDFVCAVSGGVLAVMSSAKKTENVFTHENFLLTYGLILCSPVTIRNSVYWTQCDSIYVSFVLLAVICMLKEKYPLSMILWGFAFAFKLQAVFALPMLLIYYWKNKKFSALQFLWIPLTMEILCIPAIIGGCSPFITIETYMGQAGSSELMYQFYPNLWGLLPQASYWVFAKMTIVGLIGLLGILAVIIVRKEERLDCSNFLLYFTWITMTVMFFLPAMHERYGYLLEMLAVCLFAVDKKKWYLPVITHSISYLFYLGWFGVDSRMVGVPYLVAYLLLTCSVIKKWMRGGAVNA